MIEIVHLAKGQRPRGRERYLVIEWLEHRGSSVQKRQNGFHYKVGLDKHRFWSVEALFLARRMNLEKVYYIGRPSLPDGQAETRSSATVRSD